MSIRGVISGVAGSAGVAVVAALSLGMTHAAAGPEPSPPPAHAQVTPGATLLKPIGGPALAQPAWLRRLLQRLDPAMAATPMEAKRRHS